MKVTTFMAIVMAVAIALFASVAIVDACELEWNMDYEPGLQYCFRWYWFGPESTAQEIAWMIDDCRFWQEGMIWD